MNPLLLLAAASMAQASVPATYPDGAPQATAAPASPAQTEAQLQAQYQSDMAAYEQSLEANHRAARRDQAHYDHQRRAYADAMAAWRDQVYACHHGSDRACNAPTPNPADFY
jgi:hypothetical protein